jgi:hypothetical protein
MRLQSLYRARFETPESWSVELAGPHGSEHQNLLFAQGRCEGLFDATLRAVNFPRRRADDTVLPDFRGVLQTDDGATILFTWHGFGTTAADGVRRIVGSVTHVSDDERYRRLNDVICTLAGIVEPRRDGPGLDVTIEVAELLWEPPRQPNAGAGS